MTLKLLSNIINNHNVDSFLERCGVFCALTFKTVQNCFIIDLLFGPYRSAQYQKWLWSSYIIYADRGNIFVRHKSKRLQRHKPQILSKETVVRRLNDEMSPYICFHIWTPPTVSEAATRPTKWTNLSHGSSKKHLTAPALSFPSVRLRKSVSVLLLTRPKVCGQAASRACLWVYSSRLSLDGVLPETQRGHYSLYSEQYHSFSDTRGITVSVNTNVSSLCWWQ